MRPIGRARLLRNFIFLFAVGCSREEGAEFSAAPWEEARARGVDFRAIGQEPGWLLEIDDESGIRFLGDYGEFEVDIPISQTSTHADGAIRLYHAVTDRDDLKITITLEPCADVMSGQEFDYKTAVKLDEKTYQGCGRRLE